MSKVSLKELAQELNVSVSTVSKALKGSYEIGEHTTRRVVETAERMGYRPSPYAGFLRNQRSKTIAMVVPELDNNFFIQAISGAESLAREKNYHLLIYVTRDDYQREASILGDLRNGRVDGVILSLASTTSKFDHVNDLINTGIPVVFFDRICHEIETAKVITDDFACGFKATEHLIKNNCRDIAFLSISDSLSIDNKRKQGYLEALSKYDLKANASRVIKLTSDYEANYKEIRQLLKFNSKFHYNVFVLFS